MTFANLSNNQTKVEELAARGCLDQVVIVTPGEMERRGNVESMDEMIYYFSLKGDRGEVERIKGSQKRLCPAKAK